MPGRPKRTRCIIMSTCNPALQRAPAQQSRFLSPTVRPSKDTGRSEGLAGFCPANRLAKKLTRERRSSRSPTGCNIEKDPVLNCATFTHGPVRKSTYRDSHSLYSLPDYITVVQMEGNDYTKLRRALTHLHSAQSRFVCARQLWYSFGLVLCCPSSSEASFRRRRKTDRRSRLWPSFC